MLTRPVQHAAFCGVLLTTLLPSSIIFAAEFSQLNRSKLTTKPANNSTQLNNDNAKDLPQQSAIDSQGNVIELPDDTRSALEYRADDIYLKPSLQQHIDATHQATSSSRQANITMADDPNCRWLNNRIKHLKNQQRQTQHSQFSHYQDEIDIREAEWDCLKCASSGPNSVDRGACQYKR